MDNSSRATAVVIPFTTRLFVAKKSMNAEPLDAIARTLFTVMFVAMMSIDASLLPSA